MPSRSGLVGKAWGHFLATEDGRPSGSNERRRPFDLLSSDRLGFELIVAPSSWHVSRSQFSELRNFARPFDDPNADLGPRRWQRFPRHF